MQVKKFEHLSKIEKLGSFFVFEKAEIWTASSKWVILYALYIYFLIGEKKFGKGSAYYLLFELKLLFIIILSR